MCCDNVLLKSEYLLPISIVIAVFIHTNAIPQQAITIPVEQSNALTLSPVPFVGVLMFRPEPNATIAVAGLILIHPKIAIVNADDLAKIKKYFKKNFEKVTNLMFLSANNKPWFAKVTNICIHPEYNKNTMATIGTVYLKYDDKKYKGPMLRWPDGDNNVSYAGGEIFVFGFTDRTEAIEQIVYRMDYVSFIECYNFYVDEELNSQWMQPASYHCYRVRFSSDPCVFDPGMALVHHFNGTWTLLGMSSWGPGCSLPARFLDFEYFIPWIADKIASRRAVDEVKKMQDFFTDEEGPPPRERLPDLDAWMLNRLNDSAITLTPVTKPAKGVLAEPESVLGKCNIMTMQDKQMIYRDRMNFTSLHKGTKAVGVYGLSLYDLRFNKTRITCVSIIAYCTNKSAAKLFYTKDFEQNYLFEDVVAKKPLTLKKRPPKVYSFLNIPWSAFVDTLPSDVINLMFRFEYEDQGFLEVGFYGNKSWHYEFLTTTSSTTNKLPVTPVWINVGHRTPWVRNKTKTAAPRKATTTPPKTTTNWWSKWWKYQSHYKVPGEDGGDVDWFKG